GNDIGRRRVQDGAGQLRGSEPGGMKPRDSGPQFAFDCVIGHYRIVDEKAQRYDERRDGDLLQVDVHHVYHPECHRERDGHGERHQQRRTPLPEPDKGDHYHQADGLVKRLHEEIDVFFHLQRLVGGTSDDQVGWQSGAHLFHLLVYRLAELLNLLPGSHVNGDRDCAVTVRLAIFIRGCVEVQEIRRTLITAGDVHQIAKADGRSRLRAGKNVADRLGVVELA